MRDEIDDLLKLMADLVLEGRELEDVEDKLTFEAWRALLHVAGGWYYLGRDAQADRVVLAVRNVLLNETTEDIREKNKLACGYASTVGRITSSCVCAGPAGRNADELEGHWRRLHD